MCPLPPQKPSAWLPAPAPFHTARLWGRQVLAPTFQFQKFKSPDYPYSHTHTEANHTQSDTNHHRCCLHPFFTHTHTCGRPPSTSHSSTVPSEAVALILPWSLFLKIQCTCVWCSGGDRAGSRCGGFDVCVCVRGGCGTEIEVWYCSEGVVLQWR